MSVLSGRDKQELHAALIDAFPTLDKLAQLLSFGLDTNLQAIAGDDNLSDATAKVIEWADAHDRARELLLAASKANPGNQRLASVSSRLLTATGPGFPNIRRRLFATRTLVVMAWCVLLLAVALSPVVRIPADVDLTVDTRLVTLRLGSGSNLTAGTLASLSAQNLELVRVVQPGLAAVEAPSRNAALTADDVSDVTIALPGKTLVELDTTPDEPGTLKIGLRQGKPSMRLRAQRFSVRCPGCDQTSLALVRSTLSEGAVLQLSGTTERTILLLSSDKDTLSLPDLDLAVADRLTFEEIVDDRAVSTIERGVLTYRGAALDPVRLENKPRLIAGGLTGTLGVKTATGLQVRFAGRARSLTIVEGGAARDLRPTMFAVLLQNPAVMVIPLALLLVGSWLSARRSWSWKESLS